MHHCDPSTACSHRPRRLSLVVAATTVIALLGVGAAAPSAGTPVAAPPQGAPAPTGFGEPGTPVRPASERYVREAYGAVLHRDADEGGLAYWGGRLDDGTSRGTFARQLVLSRESLTDHLTEVYGIAHHSPEAGELDGDIAEVRARRATVESILAALLGDSAYVDGQGGGYPAGFVVALYRDVLGRTVAEDDPGVQYWTARVGAGGDLTTTGLARAFVVTPERLRPVVTDAYDRLLGRRADTGGRDYWVARIRRGETILDIDRNLLASGEAWGMGCPTLDTARCLLPFPNDRLTMPDPATDTGKRVVLKSPWVPAPDGGPAFDPTEWNRQDGFSPGSAILIPSRGIDPAQSGMAPITDMGASLDAAPTIRLIDMDTGQRWPYWAELDARAPSTDEQALIIRPARNLTDGHTYAVGIGPVRDAAGSPVPRPAGFARCAGGDPQPDRRVQEECDATQPAIDAVAADGIAASDQYLSWSFTVASTRNLAERITTMRNDVLGGAAGLTAAPFTVSGTSHDAGAGVTRVDGTFEVPKYLTGDGAPGSRLRLGADDLPEPSGTYTAPFTCTIPDEAATTPARASIYGHGLLGTGSQANSSYIRSFSAAHDIAFCGTDYLGLADEDLPNTAGILGDLSRFSELVDRNQQGLLDQMVLGRLMTLPDGFATASAFQTGTGTPLIDPAAELTYYGNSQGGIMGGALVAVDPDISRGVLGVPGMNYSTLLERSVDFDPFFAIFSASYSDPLDRTLLLSVIQMLWDRGEANGYANHVTSDPLPGTGPTEVLLHVAFGDHQVAQVTADNMARTYGAATNDPPLAPGRSSDVAPLWDIPRIPAFPHAGSAIVYWDSGTPEPPLENLPNRAGDDPHGDPRSDPDAQAQMSDFLQPGGVVTDQCGGSWCEADGT